MRTLAPDTTPIEIAAAVATLAFPPVKVAMVANYNAPNGSSGVVPQLKLEMWADAVSELTAAEYYGITEIPAAVALDTVVSVTNATDNIEATGHGLVLGQGPIRFTGTDLPSGLLENTDYWAATIVDVDNFKVATSLENAIEGTVQALADDGSGVMTFIGATATEIRYMSYGLLGQAADGAVSLTAVLGYTLFIDHHPRTIGYAISATISAGNVSASLTPVRDK